MDVGEYIRRKQKEEEIRQKENEQNKQTGSGEMSTEEAVKKYSSMSEEQLMQELFRVGRVSSGNVSASELDAFYNRVKPMLTNEQSAKMKNLIMQLKIQ